MSINATHLRRRTIAALWAGILAISTVLNVPAGSNASTEAGNPIPAENLLDGNEDWDLVTFAGNTPAEETLNSQEVVGYASDDSVAPGGQITFHISVSPTQGLEKIEIYRMGHYQRLGGRQITSTLPIATVANQPQCPLDATTGRYECSWPSTFVLNVPSTWLSGVYIAKPYNDNGFTTHITFVVRDDNRTADILFVLPMMSHAAYNSYPRDPGANTGKRLFDSDSYGLPTSLGTQRAVKVSLDRPNITSEVTGRRFGANNSVFDTYWIRWFERNGYNITYASDIDVHENPTLLKKYPVVIMGTGAEYWTSELFTAFEQARDAGVHLIFAGGANALWQVRLEPNSAGKPNRTVVGYKSVTLDPAANALKTVEFSSATVNRPEQRLVGVMFDAGLSVATPASYTVANANHWAYASTGLANGGVITNLVGPLIDKQNLTKPVPISTTYVLLANSVYNAPNGIHNSAIYTAPSGSMVWATGTSTWAWALERVNVSVNPELSYVKPVVLQITKNIVDGMLANPVKMSGLGSASSTPTRLGDSTAFTATIAAGQNVAYAWNFGDGSAPGAGSNPSRIYAAAGQYSVVVTATNAAGVLTSTLTVLVTNAAPVANAGADQSAGVGAIVALNGSGSTDPDAHMPLLYNWTQTAGPAVTLSSSSVAAPTFTAPGAPTTLRFALTVTDARGLVATTTDSVDIVVANAAIAGLSAQNNGPVSVGAAANLTASVSSGSSVTYTWHFGDGTLGAGALVSKTYAVAGTYTATVTATNSLGSVVATTTVVVRDLPIQNLSIGGPLSTTVGASTTFTAGQLAGTGATYAWTLSGPVSGTGTGQSFAFVFAVPGTYTVTVQATNSIGSSQVTRQVTVAGNPGGSSFKALIPIVSNKP